MSRRKERITKRMAPGQNVMEYYRYKMRDFGPIEDVEAIIFSSMRYGILIPFGILIGTALILNSFNFDFFTNGLRSLAQIFLAFVLIVVPVPLALSSLPPRWTHKRDKISYWKISLFAFMATLVSILFFGTLFALDIRHTIGGTEIMWNGRFFVWFILTLRLFAGVFSLPTGLRFAYLMKKLEQKRGGVVYPT